MRFSIALLSITLIPVIFASDEDFDAFDENAREKRAPDYGGGLGGPLAASIWEKRLDKDENSTVQPHAYTPDSNIGNSKRCEVVRSRKALIGSEAAAADDQASQEFETWCKKYKKRYPTAEAKDKARIQFIRGKEGVNSLQGSRCSGVDAQFAMTRYSDWTTDDFVQKLGGARDDPEESATPIDKRKCFKITEPQARWLWKIPKWDWRTYGVLARVRDQKECGGCYAFSTTDQLSSQQRIDKKQFLSGEIEPYSAQYIIDCMPEPYGYGCKGGRPAAVLEYLSKCKDCTPLVDRCYQYRNKHLRCKGPSMNCKNDLAAKPVFSKQACVISDREAETMAALLRWGPVVAVVELGSAWQYYNGSGIMRENHCGKKPNHAVLIVGYDYTGDVPYYIVRNSWSADWGDNGYVKLEAGKNTCGIATAALVTCTDQAKCGSFRGMEDFVKNPNVKPNILPDGTFM